MDDVKSVDAASRARPAGAADRSEPLGLGDGPFALSLRGEPGSGLGPVTRLALAGLVLVTLAAAGAGWLGGFPALRSGAVGVFLLAELGIAPWLLVPRMRPRWFALLAITTGLAATVTVGFSMSVAHFWHPVPVFLVIAAATVALLSVSIRRDWPRARATASAARVLRAPAGSGSRAEWIRRMRPALVVLGLTIAGVLVSAIAAVLGRSEPQPAGLFASLGPVWYVGLALIVAAAAWAWKTHSSTAAPVLALSGIVVLSQSISYASPVVMSASRHVSIVEYIRANGGADPGLDIYQAWSGLFAGIAWVADAAGLADPMVVAAWWPVLLSPALALAVAVLAGRWLAGAYRAWMAAAIFALTTTLNVVYFSPQSVALLFALVIFALAVEPRGTVVSMRDPAMIGRLALIAWLASAMAVTHQLSPYLTTAALAALVIFRLVRPWWMPLVVLLPALAWAAVNSAVLGRFISLGAVGRFWENIRPPAHEFTQFEVPLITRAAFYGPAAVLLLVGIVAVVCVARVRSRAAWALLAAAASTASLFAATDYGQEGIFRATLFAGPWLAILAAGIPVRRFRCQASAVAAVLAGMLAMNAFGLTALDWNRVITRDSAEATRIYEESAPADSLMLLTGTQNATPQGRTARYLEVWYLSREGLGGYPSTAVAYDAAADVAILTRELVTTQTAPAYYALVSTSIGAYGDRYGFQSYAHYEELTAAMAASPLWVPIYSGPTTTLYILRDPGAALG